MTKAATVAVIVRWGTIVRDADGRSHHAGTTLVVSAQDAAALEASGVVVRAEARSPRRRAGRKDG